ncbi:MAG: sigma-70 family RNA polymerase sigma factor [Bradyrhizobiaceae bacterium]|nr:MAG: sigma-70 family RNA polymerase sigma factor [Bradyrhizobiaceae bacterium]
MRGATRDPLPPFSAENLVLAIAARRDRDAFRGLYEFYAPRIHTMMVRSGASAELAEDIAQETLITVWRKANSYNPARATVSAWIYTIARNLRIDRFRRDRRAKLHEVYELVEPESVPSSETSFEAAEEEDRVRQALKHLPDEQIRVVELSFFEGRSHEDIAKTLGIPLGTVKSRLRLAMQRLRIFLGEGQ